MLLNLPIVISTLTVQLTTTSAVSVLLGGTRWRYKDYHGATSPWRAGCPDLQPGECCRKPPGLIIDPGFTTFTALSDLDIAFLWRTRPPSVSLAGPASGAQQTGRQGGRREVRGCSGVPFRSHMAGGSGGGGGGGSAHGGASWTYQWRNLNPFGEAGDEASARVAGASYLRLPPRLPPDEEESVWLGVEGLRGFVWGGGRWFAHTAKYAGGGRAAALLPKRDLNATVFPGPQIAKNRSFFGGGRIVAGESGVGERWADWVEVNGSRYDWVAVKEGEGEGGLRYRSRDGDVLDFSETDNG